MSGVRGLSGASGPVAGGEDGGQVLEHSDGPWLRAAGGAESLRTHLGPVRSELAMAHEGLMAAAGGLSALAELGTVRTSWERRIAAARGECGALAGKLRVAACTQGETDEAVKSCLAAVAGPKDGAP